ncbi:UDP-N-acetylmuramate--L-alanine ligase [Candidatus Epulonipiscium viviparus]|uniref:UDP-N-acetylmuramate--L-alanine ligase n=1 Tax=Candidatus Epulonipiscium viviparus TaxID=420336 RepID=UPI00273808A8|nr:UDP-N-acetylmuramate--L-alanine ligase [Candidatus Epulopiscium viviparus]
MNNTIHIHFIGIGGISMSGLAEIMVTQGHKVTGSDIKTSDITDHLESLGVTITPHSKDNITTDIDLVVITAAINENNEELKYAKELGKKIVTRAEFLGDLMATYEFPICIAGTHGKTTTTSMLANILLHTNNNPTITVGGIVDSIGGNIHIGDTKYFLTEACEYHNSFLDFNPMVGVILNIEEDHMDFFKDLDDIKHSFTEFASLIPKQGLLVIEETALQNTPAIKNIAAPIETFGLSKTADWSAQNISFDANACPSFDVYYKNEFVFHIAIALTGTHNVLNTLSAIAVCHFLDIPVAEISKDLIHFSGAKRRFEMRGKIHDILLIDDYAHHPSEIKATLNTVAKYPHKNLYVVFQPHTYSRTKTFLNGFVDALSTYGQIIVTDIYAARETNPGDIHSRDLVKLLQNKGTNSIYIESFDEISDYLLTTTEPGDIIMTMGAGNVNQIIDTLLGKS